MNIHDLSNQCFAPGKNDTTRRPAKKRWALKVLCALGVLAFFTGCTQPGYDGVYSGYGGGYSGYGGGYPGYGGGYPGYGGGYSGYGGGYSGIHHSFGSGGFGYGGFGY